VHADQAAQYQYGGLKDELIRDRLVSGILNDQVPQLTLAKTIKLIKPRTFKLKTCQYLELAQCRQLAHTLKKKARERNKG